MHAKKIIKYFKITSYMYKYIIMYSKILFKHTPVYNFFITKN